MRFATRRVVCFFVVCFAVWCGALAQSRAAAQYTLLHAFAGGPNDGLGPLYNSTVSSDGTTLYGVTPNGGITNRGVVFKININGSGYQVLHFFNGLSFTDMLLGGKGNTNDGVSPDGTPLLIGATLYGTTTQGGTNGLGTVYKINTDGSGFQLLHSFGLNTLVGDGSLPQCSLVTDGTSLYGMTTSGSGTANDLGTIFKIDTNGNYQVLHNFGVQPNNGNSPQGSLMFSGGTLYGMTLMGGTLGSGTIFKVGTDGLGFQIIHNFIGTLTDGASPYGSVIISGSTLYGMTSAGGSNGEGTVFSVDTSGNGFTILHNFSTTDTWGPLGDLTLSGSTLFGMARNSGFSLLGSGTIFQINTDGSGFQIPHVFSFPSQLTDGSTPYASLVLIGSTFYGMTHFGGSAGNSGALFSFTPNGGGGGGGGGPVTALRVTIQPATAVKAGAQWQVNGSGVFLNSGALASNLTAGAHVVSYKTVKGFVTPAPQIIDITAGITNTITGIYGVADTTVPTLKVITPTSKTSVNSGLFTASGTASDNVGVALVFYQLNSGVWTAADSSNSFTNWTAANLALAPGVNVMKFYAKDLSGNVSATNTVSFTYVVSAPLAVNLNPPTGGSTKGPLNGQLLQIGKPFTLSVKAAKGYAFLNWTGGTNTTSTRITFLMASNLVFTANFKDTTRPVNVILSPTKGQTLSNAAPTATGRAMDNTGVTAVWCRVNGGAWFLANLPDGTNWQTGSLSTSLAAGPNTISAYALDAAGNASLTNTIAFTYVAPPSADWAPDSLNRLLAFIAPSSGSQEMVGFDLSTFAQTSASNDGNPDNYGGGTYTYLKTDTNMAQLSLAFTAPPGASNNPGPINLVFTNHYAGYFTNDGGDTGGLNLQAATAFIPTAVAGKTLNAVSDHNGKTTKIKLASATAFTKTPANNSSSGSSSGTYTFTRFSPICGAFSFTFTSAADAGQTAYVQATFTSATGGTYLAMVFDSSGALQDIDTGHFTM